MAPVTDEKSERANDRSPGAAGSRGGTSKACKTYEVELSAYFDGELEGAALQRMEAHLAGCAGCRDTLQRLGKLRKALLAMAKPPRRRRSILEDLQARLAEEGAEEAAEEPEQPPARKPLC
jgi:anti-sigma factor RsiW